MSELRKELRLRVISFLAWGLVQLLGRTARLRAEGFEHVRRPADAGHGFIMAVWHGRTLLPIYYCRKMGIWAITSLSRDGEIQTRTVSRFGYRIIRGSTGRGGMKAALTACKRLQEGGILSITPDGPKGPPNQVQEGIIFMARRTGCPIIPIGVSARPGKLMNAWDSYLLPAPFAKCAIIFGEPIHLSALPEGESAESVIKTALDDYQSRAEQMVGGG